jgi:hypothetical protein
VNEFRTKLDRGVMFWVLQSEYAAPGTIARLDDGDGQAGIRHGYSRGNSRCSRPNHNYIRILGMRRFHGFLSVRFSRTAQSLRARRYRLQVGNNRFSILGLHAKLRHRRT